MNKLWVLSILLCTFLIGCTSEEKATGKLETKSTSLLEETKEELADLKSKLNEHNQSVEKLKEEFEFYKLDSKDMIQQLQIELTKTEHLIINSPFLTQKQGYILEVLDKDGSSFLIDFAEMVEDQEAPNGFHIENNQIQKETYSAIEEVGTFLMDGAKLVNVSKEEFLATIRDNEYPRLFNFYFIEGKLVLISEQYLP